MWRQWIVPCVLTALCAAGLTLLVGRPDDAEPASPRVGDCFAVRSAKKHVGLAPADCGAEDAMYRTAVIVKSPDWTLDPGACPAGPYRANRPDRGDTLCLMPNVRAGDCLQTVHANVGSKTAIGKRPCGDASESKVTKVVTGPRQSCDPGEVTTFYSEPATTICLQSL